MKFCLAKSLFVFSLCFFSSMVHALPIGFGINQGELEYLETKSKRFKVYHDKESPNEGAMVVNALEAARPILASWMGIVRKRPLPVVMSARTANASFANFMFDSIELQTMGEGGRDLFWHEYIHNHTYRHFTNFLGPAESVFYLPWVPAWFIEGLAEALSVSLGSDVQAGIEKLQSHYRTWPSFDSLHSLYNQASFRRGYATAGGFVAWIFRKIAKKDGSFLKRFLKKLSSYTMPIYYPWAVNPLSDFMPMDEVLRDFLGQPAEKLYESYKKESEAYWKSHGASSFLGDVKGFRRRLSTLASFSSRGQDAFLMVNSGGITKEHRLRFNDGSGWHVGEKAEDVSLLEKSRSLSYLTRDRLTIAIASRMEMKTGFKTDRLVILGQNKKKRAKTIRTLVRIKGRAYGIFEGPDKIIWLEHEAGTNRLCYFPKKLIKRQGRVRRDAVRCPVVMRSPKTLELLGDRKEIYPKIGVYPPSSKDLRLSSEIWFAEREETLRGDRVKIFAWETSREQLRTVNYNCGGHPLDMAVAGGQIWLLVAEHNRRSLRKIDPDGRCVGVVQFPDHVVRAVGLDDGSLALGIDFGESFSIRKISPDQLKLDRPYYARSPDSPLLQSLKHGGRMSFPSALQMASIWSDDLPEKELKEEQNILALSSGLDRARSDTGKGFVSPKKAKPASWRSRPVFALPWVGGEDLLGPQLGIISVPLMENRQNESLRVSALVGIESRYPNVILSFQSHRFWPDIKVEAYKAQVWDGSCRFRLRERIFQSVSYMDEVGLHPEAKFGFHFWDFSANAAFGARLGQIERYQGICPMVEGFVSIPHLDLSLSHSLGRFRLSYQLGVKIAPPQTNKKLDFNRLNASARASTPLPFFRSRLSLSLEGSRTRGKRAFNLKETYQPLKTFIPGSGGGLNKVNQSFTDGGMLFRNLYGDTQARARASWTAPIISRIDRQIWLVYLQSLNFTTFFNYGGAWTQGRSDINSQLLKAHGYNLDLLFENKGIGFNLSLGTGQVVGDDFQVYASFGFDAFF